MSAARLQTGRPIALPGANTARPLLNPLDLIAEEHEPARTALVHTSDAAFGRATAVLWERKFMADFLGGLDAFFLIEDGGGGLIGWSGYRTTTVDGDTVIYFTSTGLLPTAQGRGLVPALQRHVIDREAAQGPGRPVTTAVRTRNPHSYRLATKTFGTEPVFPGLDGTVPPQRRRLVAGIASWLGVRDFDPVTARAPDAYQVDGGLYGNDPKTGDGAVDALFARLGASDALLVCGRRPPRAAMQRS